MIGLSGVLTGVNNGVIKSDVMNKTLQAVDWRTVKSIKALQMRKR